MAVNVGSASVTIMPSMSGFSSKMDKALGSAGKSGAGAFSRSFSKGADPSKNGLLSVFRRSGSQAGSEFGAGAASGLSKGTAALAGAVGGLASSLAGSLFGAIGNLTGEMAAASDSTQKFKSTLDFARLDTSTIDALTESTQEYADRTVYELGEVRNITAQLAANGVKDYDRLAEAAGNLNAVAGGTADTYKSVGMVLTQTAGQGKLTTENWNQLADAIPGASGKIQQALLQAGAYTGNFRDAMEKGEISAQEFNDAIMSLGFEEAAVEAARSTSTIEGAMGNLEAAAVGAGAGIIDAFKPLITGSLTGAADFVTGLGDGVARFLDACKDNGAADALAGIIGDLGGAASDVAGFVGGLVTSLLGIEPSADPAADAADALKAALEAAQPFVQGVADAAGWLRENAEQAAPVVGALAAGFALLRIAQGVGGFLSGVSTALGGVSAAAGPASAAIGSVGSSSAVTAPQILAMGAAVLMVGGGVALAAAGLFLLAQGAIQVASAGPGAAVALVGMVAGVAGLAVGAAALGPALSAGAVGIVAFGAAVLMIGGGIGLATSGVALLAGQLPTVSAYGTSAAAGIAALGASLIALGAGALTAGAGVTVFGVGMVAATAGVGAFSLALGAVSLAVGALGLGMGVLADATVKLGNGVSKAASGFSSMGKSLPRVGSAAPGAAAGLASVAGAAGSAETSASAAGSSIGSLATSSASAAVGVLALAAAFAAASAGAYALGSASSAGGAAVAVSMAAAALSVTAFGVSSAAGFRGFSDSASKAGSDAADRISAACKSMASEVSGLRLRLPRIEVGPLPHFTLSGSFNAETGSVPSVGVSWYARGGYFSGPQVIGIGEGRYDEVALPLSPRVLAGIGEGIADQGAGGDLGSLIAVLHRDLERIYEVIPRGMTDRQFGRRVSRAVMSRA